MSVGVRRTTPMSSTLINIGQSRSKNLFGNNSVKPASPEQYKIST